MRRFAVILVLAGLVVLASSALARNDLPTLRGDLHDTGCKADCGTNGGYIDFTPVKKNGKITQLKDIHFYEIPVKCDKFHGMVQYTHIPDFTGNFKIDVGSNGKFHGSKKAGSESTTGAPVITTIHGKVQKMNFPKRATLFNISGTLRSSGDVDHDEHVTGCDSKTDTWQGVPEGPGKRFALTTATAHRMALPTHGS